MKTKVEDRHWARDLLEFIGLAVWIVLAGILALCLAALPKK